MARRAVILFLPFLSALLFVSFFCLFLSLLTVESAREKYRGEKKISFSFPILDRTMYTAKTSPKYRRLRPSTRKGCARVKPPWSFRHLSTLAYSFYLSPPIDFSSLFFLSFSRFFHRVAAFLSIGAECILILPSPLFRSHSLCSRQLGPCGRFSASLARACQFSLLFCLLSRWKHADDKRHPLAKILSATAETA